MRRLAVIAALAAALGVAAGCGYEGQTTASPETVVGTVPQPTETAPVEVPEGDAAAGKVVFTANCFACHTLADAGTTGTAGPNLDKTQPDAAKVYDRVTNGTSAGMPSFKDSLTAQQIADVTAYVSTAAGS